MTYADKIFKQNIQNILDNGVFSENARPKYKDGQTANSKYVTGSFVTYDLQKGEFPITTLRPIPIKSAIKELMWIYQDQTSELAILEEKYGVKYWGEWGIGDGTIGQRYGATVKKYNIIGKLLDGLAKILGIAVISLIFGNMKILRKLKDFCLVLSKQCLMFAVNKMVRFTWMRLLFNVQMICLLRIISMPCNMLLYK